ncbi:LysM domain-containing protein [Streptomyces sp. NPDC048332]|uniref:LysM domain-containing protein n=1 Tax=Streptomyces sp. NPDC048332 TaxID=3154619 RepID=UPI00343373A7
MRTPVAELHNEAANWSPGTSTTYTVKKDAMHSSIARQVGEAGRYKQIATLNKLANPSRTGVGQVLKPPRRRHP